MPALLSDLVLDEPMRLKLLAAFVQGFDGYVTVVDRDRNILYMSRMLSRDPRETLGHTSAPGLLEPRRHILE